MSMYATLADAKRELKSDQTTVDNNIRGYLRVVSKRIDGLLGSQRRPFFEPYDERRDFLVDMHRVDSVYNTFYFRDYLLALTSAEQGGTTITSSVEVWKPPRPPYQHLRYTTRSKYWYQRTDTCGLDPLFVKITGVWGWHEDYANAWATEDALQAGMTASDTTLTVADADGEDINGFTPRFSPGNLIRVNSEYMRVVSVSANVLTVRRGVNGSTAAAHDSGDDVEVWQVDDRIRRVTARQAALLVARRGAFQVETVDGVGAVSYPQDLLSELRATVQEFV